MTPHPNFRILLVLPILFLALSCSDGKALAGRYETTSGGLQVDLVLKEGGEGEWRVDGETMRFSWEASDREIRLHTQEGGALAGSIEDSAIHLDIPGIGALTFLKASD